MIIENQGVTYFVDDEVGNDQTKTVAEVFANAIPLELHNIQENIKDLESQIETLEKEPDEILVPNENKNELPGLESELTILNEKLLAFNN